MLKSNTLKIVASALVIFMLVESISAIIGKSKGKHKRKHKDDDDDDYDDDDPTCYPGRNCIPGCYCSGEYCRPLLHPNNKAESRLKCRTFHYPQWSISKKKKGKGKHKRHKHRHHEKTESESDLSGLITKHNFTTTSFPEETEVSKAITNPPTVPSPVLTYGEVGVRPQDSSYTISIMNVSYSMPAKAVHPSQRNLRFGEISNQSTN